VARKIDDYAIREIHRHGQVSEWRLQFGRTDKETWDRATLILESIERDLFADYGLKLPEGITIHD
jgi:hypothetical protein